MTVKEIIFDSPIYSTWKNEYQHEDENGNFYDCNLIDDVDNFKERVECYCPKCGSNRVFAKDQVIRSSPMISNPHYGKIIPKINLIKTFRCSQDKEHQMYFAFLIEGNNLVKVAEFPSKLDLSKSSINKYEKILPKEKVKELGRAAQLESYGYSIAALLHYRRVFEYFIFSTFQEAEIENKYEEIKFRHLRMADKINYVKEFLPDYFIDNSFVYGILSKGIHELEESECNEYLPVVKAIIYYSLDESLDKRNKILRKEEYSKKLSAINSELNK